MPDKPPDRLTVGFVGGVRIPRNVSNFLSNVRRLLRDRTTTFECHLLASGQAVELEGFDRIDPGIEETESAIGTIRNLRAAITRYCTEREPDVVLQVTRFPAHGIATALAGRRTGTPVITRLAGDNFNEYRFAPGVTAAVRTFALKNVLSILAVHLPETVIVLGPAGEAQLRARGRRSGIVEIPQPIDTDTFFPVSEDRRRELRSDLGLPDTSTRVLLSVGRLTRRKGLHDVAATARRLAANDAAIRWVVLGDGPLRADLSSIPLVTAPGTVPPDRVADYYRATDLLVHASLHEGLPNVLLEATACGLPSLARDVGEASTVATRTFQNPTRLPELVAAEYQRPTLDERFDDDRLGRRYADALVRASRT